MVAKVISGKDIKGALNYNEQKVLEGKAKCIQANMFWKDASRLNFYDKLKRFTELNQRNQRTKTNTLHISLNFSTHEQLSIDTLNAISSTYMDRIGFGEQPYLVYEHRDAAHQHVHILTTLIQENGKRIPIHFLGKNESEKARKAIEKEFGLVEAQGRKVQPANDLIEITQAVYGKSETHRTISNIVRMITRAYKYTSLPELNAVLHRYNVMADRGTERSQMFAKKGLMYSMTDKEGKRVGIPVKASSIYGKPTLKFLEKQFRINEVLRQAHKEKLRDTIEQVLKSPVKNKEEFVKLMAAHDVTAIFRTNAEGRTYGVTFVDDRTKAVFKGSDLGKAYSANALMARFAGTHRVQKDRSEDKRAHQSNVEPGQTKTAVVRFIEDLTISEQDYAPNIFRKKRRKKKRKR